MEEGWVSYMLVWGIGAGGKGRDGRRTSVVATVRMPLTPMVVMDRER